MFAKILAEFDRVNTPLSVEGLSRRLNIQKSALEGMLQTLVRYGKIKLSDTAGDQKDSCGSLICAGCGAASRCPFAGKIPVTYTKVKNSSVQGSCTQR
jgi:hypothetical protein